MGLVDASKELLVGGAPFADLVEMVGIESGDERGLTSSGWMGAPATENTTVAVFIHGVVGADPTGGTIGVRRGPVHPDRAVVQAARDTGRWGGTVLGVYAALGTVAAALVVATRMPAHPSSRKLVLAGEGLHPGRA